ncbi:MAG: carboxypeptidase-like regulatory domain-containing protein [Flavobacteriaceae bacterium]
MFRKHVFLTLMVIGYSHFLSAQSPVTGKVVDAIDQQPLIGAQVILTKLGTGAVTDESGDFKLNLAVGTFALKIVYLGYEDLVLEIDTKNPQLGTLQLTRANTTLDEVIVSASPNNYKRDFKGSNFRLNPMTLKNLNPLNTEEVLKIVPGVNIVGDMGLSNRPNISIRGSWGRRSKKVLLMEDGSPSAPAPYIAPRA